MILPIGVSERVIHKLLESNKNWVIDKLSSISEHSKCIQTETVTDVFEFKAIDEVWNSPNPIPRAALEGLVKFAVSANFGPEVSE